MDKVKERSGTEEPKLNLGYNRASHHKQAEAAHDPRIVALVEFLARRAAEEDYKELLRALEHDDKKD